MEAFHQPIRDRVIRTGSNFVGAQKSGQGGEELRLKLPTLISGDAFWDTKARYPSPVECLGHCLSGHVNDWGGLWPTGEPVEASHQIVVAIGRWQRTYQVNVDMLEPTAGKHENSRLALGVARHF